MPITQEEWMRRWNEQYNQLRDTRIKILKLLRSKPDLYFSLAEIKDALPTTPAWMVSDALDSLKERKITEKVGLHEMPYYQIGSLYIKPE